jgi:hypothetical protein
MEPANSRQKTFKQRRTFGEIEITWLHVVYYYYTLSQLVYYCLIYVCGFVIPMILYAYK